MYFATRGLYALMESNLPSVTSVQKHRALSFWRLYAEPTPSSRYCPSASSTLLSISVFRSLFYHYRLATETEFGGGGSPVVASRVVSYFLAFFFFTRSPQNGWQTANLLGLGIFPESAKMFLPFTISARPQPSDQRLQSVGAVLKKC